MADHPLQPEPPAEPPAPAGLPTPGESGLITTRIVDVASVVGSDHRPVPPETPGAVPSQISPSGVVLDDFRLVKKIGEGAMGTVFKGHQISFDRPVAVKVLFKHVARNLRLVERFYREARVSGCLDHPNIVQGYGVGESQGWHYFAMEYVDGISMQDWLERLGKVSVGDALYVALACARGLQYAHEMGLVHRDIKPANLLITRRGEVKIADFGMVKYQGEDLSLTQTGHGVGTPWYMPLEQARNAKDTDNRCDIYALGCVLYCMLTGQPPFTQATLVEVIQAKELGVFRPARRLVPEVPERLDLIIAKMVQKQARYRYASCAEVIADLESLGLATKRLSFLKRTPPPAQATSETPPAPTRSPAAPTPPPSTVAADIWYLRYTALGGRPVERKLTTSQILLMIEKKVFDSSATASREPDGIFRALPTHREFGHLMLPRASKQGLDEQTSRYRRLYKEIDEEDRQRRQVETREPVSTARYWRGIFFRAALVAAALGLGYVGIRFLIEHLKGVFF